MTLVLARDLAPAGIRCNTIIPGFFDTPIYGGNEDMKNHLKKDTLFPKRLGDAAEYASLAVELLTNSYINGESVRIDRHPHAAWELSTPAMARFTCWRWWSGPSAFLRPCCHGRSELPGRSGGRCCTGWGE
jgi:hypothetical protein